MGQRNVRVLVGQGDQERQGFLRSVLEDDGYDVVGEATTTSDLARLLRDEHPDVVVLDDSIGVGAVQLAAEIAPSAKIIVVWPAAVVPISGAIRVEPSEVLTTLGGAVGLAVGLGGLAGLGRPEWVEKIRKDPATLREMLAAKGGVPTRPSVTELQRRGHRLHPSPGSPRRTARPRPAPVDEPSKDRDAIVTPIPIAAASAAGAATPTPAEESWNRRLGVLALGGAAVAGALMIALAFSNRAPSINSAEPLFIPPIIQPSAGPTTGENDGQPGQQPNGVPNGPGGQGPDGTANGGSNGSATTGTGGGLDTNVRGLLSGATPPSGGGGGTPGGSPGNPGGPRSSEHVPGSHANNGNGGTPGGGPSSAAPGKSASHNPHGGPPGWDHRHGGGNENAHAGGPPAHSNGNGGGPPAHANGNGGGPPAHANGHGGPPAHANSHAHKQ